MQLRSIFCLILFTIQSVQQLYKCGAITQQGEVAQFNVQPKKRKYHALVHVHIPKVGGTALSEYLKNNWCNLKCHEAKLLDTQFQNISQATPANAIRVSNPNALCYWMVIIEGAKGHQGKRIFPHMAMNYGVNLRYGTGHMPFGYCQFIESPCEYTTIFREPIDRLISQYFFMQEYFPHVLKNCQQCQTFQGYVSKLLNRSTKQINGDNLFTRFMCGDKFEVITGQKLTKGRDCGEIPFGEVNATHLEIAKENIQNFFPVIGLLHDLETYQVLMLLEYGYLPYTVPIARQTSSRKMRVEDLDEQIRLNIQQLLQWDLKLWDFAKELIQKRIRQSDSFESALNYVRNFDASLPKQTNLQLWNKSSVVAGDHAPALFGSQIYQTNNLINM